MKKSVRLLSTVLLSSLAGWANASPTIEVGTRVWVSEGETEWSHCASSACGGGSGTITISGTSYTYTMGDPTSKLNYSGTKANTLELYADIRSEQFVTSLKLGTGSGDSGTFRDQDWLTIVGVYDNLEFSDTVSDIKNSDVNYWVADFGYELDSDLLSNAVGITPFVGYFNYTEKLSAYGLTPVSDGSLVNIASSVSYATEVIRNEAEWSGFRLGVDLKKSFTEKLSGSLNVAYVIADVTNKDSHLLRTSSSDLGAAPNIISSGDGDGVMLDIILDYDYSDALTFDFGYRMWKFDADNAVTKFGPDFSPSFPSRSMYSKRDGFMLGASYRF